MKVGLTSVVIPSYARPERLLGAVESALSTASNIEVVCVLRETDDESRAILETLEGNLIVVLIDESDDDVWRAGQRWNEGAKHASGEFFFLGSDDLVFEPGWLDALFAGLEELGGQGVAVPNVGLQLGFGTYASHYLVSRAYLIEKLGGVLFPPVYQHNYGDIEVTAVCGDAVMYCVDSIVHHNHPHDGSAEFDKSYERTLKCRDGDRELFEKRRAGGFPPEWRPVLFREPPDSGWGRIAIGLRSYKSPEVGFLDSWTYLLLAGLRKGDVVMRAARGPHHIAANQLAHSFLSGSGCDSILFIDDDMSFEPDALSILRDSVENWDYDVVSGFFTFRTEPPHAVVYKLADEQPGMPRALEGEIYNALSNMPDNSVVDVDAVGMAFTLVRRHVLESMIGEYGSGWTIWFDWGMHSEGEDIRFSRRVRERGFRLAVDTHCKIGHIGARSYGWTEHQQFIKQLETNYG